MNQLLRPLEQRIRLMIGRAIVSLVNDSARMQELQVELLEGESQDGVEHFQPYGLAAHPHPGAEVLMGFVGGLRSHGIAIAVADRRYRLTGLAAGEVALFDDLGNAVRLGREAISVVAVDKVTVDAPEVTITSDSVRLGAAGGQPVARIGDDVDPVTHKIITGSSKVSAA